MSLPSLEKRRLRTSKGLLPSPYISNLASCHPFTKQIDIVFPSHPALLDSLRGIETSYARGKTSLLNLYENSEQFVVGGESRLLILSDDTLSEECWCIDYRAVLTMCVGKDAYERLGLVGRMMPFTGFEDRYVVEIDLKKRTHTPAQQARFREALKVMNVLRREALVRSGVNDDEGAEWEVLYCAVDPTTSLDEFKFIQRPSLLKIEPRQREMLDVYVPQSVLSEVDSGSRMDVDQDRNTEQDEQEEHEEEETQATQMSSFFEWVGMACIGSQRLYANDSVNPYVALYEPPEHCSLCSLTHMRWKGLIPPKLVEQVLNHITMESTSPNFVSMTSSAYTQSPVSYIPRTKGSKGSPSGVIAGKTPIKLPRRGGEDTWSLVVEPEHQQSSVRNWCLMECLGQWDTRWG